ncbi:hypothetical protein [Paucibacter sp. Y2R2-4]|uniref:hypothetical protein n=1 Tax=Paucibacter sp. Y2R2-4 TaxID=2893553 RepID=UPI0021E4CDBF|nr:hypothetical protein [Paucibacter sp. Y2R2-4]MCV2352252.1 hypothetical protein [Paucibacter sp. Y2R2-4]
MSQSAHITGDIEYREGDGANILIRRGPCEVQTSEFDVTLSWTDGETRGSTALPLSDFNRYVSTRVIQFDTRE